MIGILGFWGYLDSMFLRELWGSCRIKETKVLTKLSSFLKNNNILTK